jgi:membrane protease YdiL (CAAX protease family)
VHQEGALALVALVGLSFTERGVLGGLAPVGELPRSVAAGIAAGIVVFAILWWLREAPPLRRLEDWQRRVVGDWSVTDAVAVALVSGLGEEALLRALLQPTIGLFPAAALFAVLHIVPDRRLWLWPVFALFCGVALGLLFERFGFPAAAAAHMVINLIALLRLRRR